MVKKKYIEVTKTARYFIEGEIKSSTKRVWIITHGYAQNASYFIRKFHSLVSDEDVVVVPEALNNFYTSGTSGRVGASWMTKEERLNDIKDNINYLDQLLAELNLSKEIIINAIGFSQGAATISRWAVSTKSKISSLSLWGSIFPPDLDYKPILSGLKKIPVYLIMGNNDEYYNLSIVQEHQQYLKDKHIIAELIEYQGSHDIDKPTLLSLKERIIKRSITFLD